MDKLRVLDLFSGIGGFSLGLERAGMRTVAFCEIEPYPCRVLRKHWPAIPIFENVRTLTGKRLKKHGIEAEVICGGFPCQDISFAGKGAGLDGARSGLWSELCRIIREVCPRFAILENVAALRYRGLDRVLGDLAAIGYDAEWHCIPASALGAPHQRDRVWIVAYPDGQRHDDFSPGRLAFPLDVREALADADRGSRRHRSGGTATRQAPDAHARPRGWAGWPPEPDISRVADGIPHRLDRLRCLGNAVVPQIVEMIGRAILRSEKHRANA